MSLPMTTSERLHLAVRTLRAMRRTMQDEDGPDDEVRMAGLAARLRELGVAVGDVTAERLGVIVPALSRLTLLEVAVEHASEARRRLPAGSSRAQITTANARWSTKCEARDRELLELQRLGVDPHAPIARQHTTAAGDLR